MGFLTPSRIYTNCYRERAASHLFATCQSRNFPDIAERKTLTATSRCRFTYHQYAAQLAPAVKRLARTTARNWCAFALRFFTGRLFLPYDDSVRHFFCRQCQHGVAFTICLYE